MLEISLYDWLKGFEAFEIMYVIIKCQVFIAGSEQTTITLNPAILCNTTMPVKLTRAQVEKLDRAFETIEQFGGANINAAGGRNVDGE